MPRPTKGPRLGAGPSHEQLMLASLAASLFTHERITTTISKAKAVRPVAEQLITKARRGGLHDRREVLKLINDQAVVSKLFDEVGPRYADRPGGYTRIVRVGDRPGDRAPMVQLELV